MNSKDNLQFDSKKIKYRQYFYFKCQQCGEITSQCFYGEKNIKTTCKKCNKKNSLEKTKRTLIEKYGVDNPAKSRAVKERIRQTCLERYGTTSPSKNETIKNKQRATLKERYGSTNPGAQANHKKFLRYRDAQSELLNLEWIDKDCFQGKYCEDGPIYYTFKCLKCGTVFQDDFHSGEPICRVCNPSFTGKSKIEDEIYEKLCEFYPIDKIIRHDRTVLQGRELDFYFPEKKLAIEFNGTWWHGYKYGETMPLNEFKRLHERKRLECQKLGIQLLNIDEADYIDRPDVFLSFFKDCLCERTRIFARNCEFSAVKKSIAKEFCERYHVNGWRNASEAYGLLYNGELVCVATFSKHPTYGHECIRLCYKTGISIVGGWEKIQKHFGKQFLHYVNLNYFKGENKTGCGYRFVFNRHNIVYRNRLQKKEDILKWCKSGYEYDDSLSLFQNCLAGGGIAVFDCGNDIRVYNSNASN